MTCSLAWDGGTCRGAIEAWWHDPSTGVCMPVTYGGCGGNDNRFATRDECIKACRSSSPNDATCSQPSDCILVSPGCCAACDPVDERAFIAGNSKLVNAISSKCNVLCGACPPLPPGVFRTHQYFVPTCDNGQCTVVDIRQTTLTECQTGMDCVLRAGAQCCPSCDGTNSLVSLNRTANLQSLSCGSAPTACPACVPLIPAGYNSTCNAGRCTVVEPPCTMDHPCPL
jgi:hypothetical protein